jgi:hypothetical protein
MMSLVCPISDNYVDENTARLNALFTLAVVLIFFLTPYKWIIFLLATDFLLRRILKGRYSVISGISNLTRGILSLKKVMINAGPKLFAANVGLMLCILAGVSYYAGLTYVSYALAGTLAFFTFLESFFNICAACILYPFVSKYLS